MPDAAETDDVHPWTYCGVQAISPCASEGSESLGQSEVLPAMPALRVQAARGDPPQQPIKPTAAVAAGLNSPDAGHASECILDTGGETDTLCNTADVAPSDSEFKRNATPILIERKYPHVAGGR
eukprot:gnl/MRDRNA2_/MRDRNA2_57683_c0_seq2.p1 gnl/MRDRNA2_/MRDRNA2_57683_c0~~gnl/MRDRNA2_/MRDRNA2_57683_c0_seq2.p1  ORF type:complete len:124 (+),score=28.36 gnl/MRDRNA2_/MRDRNA2_57683_c0_seq2:224-595(+)